MAIIFPDPRSHDTGKGKKPEEAALLIRQWFEAHGRGAGAGATEPESERVSFARPSPIRRRLLRLPLRQ